MVRVYPVDKADPYMLSSYTFLVRFRPGQEREYYLARAMGPIVDEVLERLATGDRDAARNFCAAVHQAFRQTFAHGTLVALLAYYQNRMLVWSLGSATRSRGSW